MERLSMCRICLAKNLSLRVVVGTYLQDIYQSLTFMPLDTGDFRPQQVCHICWARLKKCYQLREDCLKSEQFFAQMLINNMAPSELVVVPSTNSMGPIEQCVTGLEVKVEPLDSPEEYDDVEYEKAKYPLEVAAHSEPTIPTDDSSVAPLKQEHYLEVAAHSEPIDPVDDLSFAPLKQEHYVEVAAHSEPTDPVDYLSVAPLKQEHYLEVVAHSEPTDPVDDSSVEPLKQEHSEHSADDFTPSNCSLFNNDQDVPTNSLMSNENKDQPQETEECKPVIQNTTNGSSHSNISDPKDNEYKETFTQKIKTPFRCAECKKYLKSRSSLLRHRRLHFAGRFHCDVCKKRFIFKYNLIDHLRTHTGEKPFQCPIGKKIIRTNIVLKRHILTHTGGKPFQCNKCEKSFNRRHHLNRHCLTHTSEKPFQCHICKKYFSRKDHLIRHCLTHTSEKPFQCNICKKCFYQKAHLNTHYITHSIAASL